MSGIQFLLLGGVVAIFCYYIFRIRSAIFDLLITSVFFSLAVFFILSPDSTNSIAAKLGVGRGADLLFYCCILFFLFAVLKLLARIRRLETKLTDLVREQAKKEARILHTPSEHDGTKTQP
jgi:hypothetical protein